MTSSGDIAVDGQHLTLESRANTLPEIRPCKSKHDGSPRSNREMINTLILGRPVPKHFLLKWPPDHLVKPENELRGIPKTPLAPNFSTLPRHKWGGVEIESLIRDKIYTQGMEGIRQVFQVHQLPEHAETIKKDMFSKVIYHLCGYFTKKQIDEFLERMGLAGSQLINFDEFIAKFQDHEVIKDGWVSPVTRKRLLDPRFNPPREAKLLSDSLGPSFRRTLTGPFAVEQMKAKLYQGKVKVEDMFPPAVLRERGLILPPQLREAFASQGLDLEANEFWALWRRICEVSGMYDLENAGAIPKEKLFKLWGLDKEGRPILKHMVYHRSQTVPNLRESASVANAYCIAVEDLNEHPPSKPTWEIDPLDSTTDPAAPIPKSLLKMKSKEFMHFLREKFESASRQLTKTFEKYDPINCGQASLSLMQKVLKENGIDCEERVLNNMLVRLAVPADENGVYYTHFVSILGCRAEQVKIDALNKLVPSDTPDKKSDGKNENSDDGQLETSIVDFLAADFLAVVKGLKDSDKENNCLVGADVVMTQLEKALKFSLSPANKQCLNSVIFKKPQEDKVAFHHFLRQLAKSFTRLELHTAQSTASSTISLRTDSVGYRSDLGSRQSPREKEPPSPMIRALRNKCEKSPALKRYERTVDTLKEIEENPSDENMYNLPITMLEMIMQEVGKNKVHSLHKAFLLLTRNGKKTMNKLEFADVLVKIGIPLASEEIDKLWSLFPLDEDTGEVPMEALVGRFTPGYPGNAIVPPANSKRPIPVTDEELIAKAKEKLAIQRRQRKVAPLKAKPERCGVAPGPDEETRMSNRRSLAAEREKVRQIMENIKPMVLENLSALRDKLRELDSMGLGYVKRNLIETLFRQYRFPLSPSESSLLCRAFDVRNDGNFHYLKFLELYLPPIVRKEHEAPPPIDSSSIIQVLRTRILAKWKNLRRAFVQHDVNRDGYLQTEEFLAVLRNHGIHLSEEDLYHLMSDIDTNMDGKLSYAEFLKYFLV